LLAVYEGYSTLMCGSVQMIKTNDKDGNFGSESDRNKRLHLKL
jgi:hypothetical protein